MDYNLDDLRCLLAVVQAGSMTRAAPTLGVSTAAVSRRVERLEARLGVHLLHRGARGVTPTADARLLLRMAEPLLGDLEAVVRSTIRGDEALSGRVRVAAPRAIADSVLTDWLLAFAREHPELRLELITTDAWVDLAQKSLDLALRLGPTPDDDGVVPLGAVGYALVHARGAGAPLRDALATRGWAGLGQIPAVVAAPTLSWRAHRGETAVTVRPPVAFSVDSVALAARAVARGVGIGYLPLDVALRADLRRVPLADYGLTPMRRPLVAVTRQGELRRRAVRAVVETIRARIRVDGETVGIRALDVG